MRLIRISFFILALLILSVIINSCGIKDKIVENDSILDEIFPVKSGDKWGYIDVNGSYIINPQFEYADAFWSNLALVKYNQKFGFINKEGKFIINPIYTEATPFVEDLACVVIDSNNIQYINKDGIVQITLPNALRASFFSDGLAYYVDSDSNTFFIDKEGQVKFSNKFSESKVFSNGLAAVKVEDKWGYIDKFGTFVINPQFKSAYNFINDIAIIEDNNSKWGTINKQGQYLITPQFDNLIPGTEELFMVEAGTKFGFINQKGIYVINPQYKDANYFSNNLAPVQLEKTYGYINKDGQTKINFQFDEAYPYIKDIAFVKTGKKIGIIDLEGKYISNPQFDDLNFISFFYYKLYGIPMPQTIERKQNLKIEYEIPDSEDQSHGSSDNSIENMQQTAKQVVSSWLACWQARDLDCYKSYITSDYIFAPSNAPSQDYYTRLTTISKHFSTRKWINIEHSNFVINVGPEFVTVSYFQTYSSDEYSDYGYKVLYLKKENGKLKIFKDTFKPA